MKNRCPKCKQKLQGGEFLCPHCGHILGQPVYTAPKQKPERKIPMRQIFRILGALFLIAAILAAAWGISRLAKNIGTTGPTVPTTAPTEPPTVAPLVSYHVKLTADTKYWIPGITVHFCKDGEELYSGQVEEDGEITFIAPKGEGYSIRLSDLFPALDFHYGDAEIPFPKGSNTLNYHLKNKDVQYTVRVVNTAGEPVPGVLVEFNAASGQFIRQQVTGENGTSVFAADYDPDAYCSILTVPNAYALETNNVKFEYGSFVLELVVHTYEEMGLDPADFFMVKFVDEYGAPIRDMYVLVHGGFSQNAMSAYTLPRITNQEGCVSFMKGDGYIYHVSVPNNPDYSDTYFSLDPHRNEQTITLHLYMDLPEYTYTVYFYNQIGVPIPGVTIFYENNGEYFYSTSNEEGQITFTSLHKDPTQVKFRIDAAPAGCKITSADLIREYTFDADSRTLEVELEHLVTEYTIWVYRKMPDGSNAGVPGTAFDLLIGEDRYSCKTKATASCRADLPFVYSMEQFSVELTDLPNGYEDYVLQGYTVGGDDDLRYIIIYIAEKPQTTPEYEVKVYALVNSGYETVQDARFHLIIDGERYADETGADGSCWPPLPQITDFSQLRVELISLPEAYQDYVVWDYSVYGNEILIFLGPAPEPPVEEGTT